jgi:L-fuculose-phosphate aldolase
MAATPPAETELRSLVSQGSRVLAANGHEDFVWGHAAVPDPLGRGVWMKPNGIGLGEVDPGDVLLVGPDGTVLAGGGSRHKEYPIHTEIAAARGDVGGIVHTHPTHSIALAAAGKELLPISHEATALVPPALPVFDLTTNLITTPELGRELAQALGDAPAILMLNHGIVTVGPDLPTAVVRAIVLERACERQLVAEGFGGSKYWSSDEEALAKREEIWGPQSIEVIWEQLLRGLGRTLAGDESGFV